MKKIQVCVAAIVAVAVAAVVAGSASAAATTLRSEVYVGASPGTTLFGSETLNFALKSGATARMVTQVGTKNTRVELVPTGAACSSCILENKEVTEEFGKAAYGTGKLRFTGVTVATPTNCTVVSDGGVKGEVVTKELKIHADFMNTSVAVQHFSPLSGTTFATFELQGASCPVAGLYSVKGTDYTDMNDATGLFAKSHEIVSSLTNNQANGGSLTVGSQIFELLAFGNLSLGSGNSWAIKP